MLLIVQSLGSPVAGLVTNIVSSSFFFGRPPSVARAFQGLRGGWRGLEAYGVAATFQSLHVTLYSINARLGQKAV